MSEKKVPAESIEKALSALKAVSAGEDMAKSGNTINAKVPGFTGEAGSTQLFHTPSDSAVGSWAGTTLAEVGGGGIVDAVDANGTDYKNGGGAVIKSVLSLLAAGKLTPEVAAVILEKALPFEKKDDKGDKDDEDKDDDKKDVKKSAEEGDLEKSIAANATVNEGFEVSEFLREFGSAIVKSQNALQAEVKALRSELNGVTGKTGAFQKSLADAVVQLGEAVVGQNQRIETLAVQPTRGPKSVSVIEKSFAGGKQEDTITKAQLLDAAVDLVTKGQLNYSVVTRLEAGGTVYDNEMATIRANVK